MFTDLLTKHRKLIINATPQPPPTISPQTQRWALKWTITILLLTCLPYLIVTLMAPDGWHFIGILVNPFDGHSYLAKMRQGFAGNWLFHLTYTPEPHQGAFIFTFYLLLGHLAALTGLPLIVVFHLARLLAGFFLLSVAIRFIGHVTPRENEQRLAFMLLITASGFGWVGVMFGAFPIDLWVPEAFVPYSLLANPHFPLAMALMLVILQQTIWPGGYPSLEKSNISYGKAILWSSLAALSLALILPFALLTIWAILGVYLSWLCLKHRRLPWVQIWPTLGVILFSAPIILYDYWVSTTNPALSGWSHQNITTAPSLLNLILGYGLVGLLAIGGGWVVIKQKSQEGSRVWRHATAAENEELARPRTATSSARGRASRLITILFSKETPPSEAAGLELVLVWAITTLILIYLPFDLQRRLINGLHLPLCILAAVGFERGTETLKVLKTFRVWLIKYQRQLRHAVITMGLIGTLFVWILPIIGASQPPEASPITALFFLRESEQTVFNWLREKSSPDDVILAGPRLGMFLPGQTGARAFYGHPFETIAAQTKKALVEAVFRGEIEQVSPPVDFIIYGPDEQALGQPKNLAAYPVVFSTKQVTVYKVTP